MTVTQKYPSSTAIVAAGWTNPTDAYSFNNTYAYSETAAAEQEYADYGFAVPGNEIIEKVYAVIKWFSTVTTVVQGDAANFTCSIEVYDGSTWQTYQVTKETFAVSTANDESLVCTSGDTGNSQTAIDVTSFLNTPAKVNNSKTRLLFTIGATAAGITLRWSVDCISLLACHNAQGGIPATTKQSLSPKLKNALLHVKNSLKSQP